MRREKAQIVRSIIIDSMQSHSNGKSHKSMQRPMMIKIINAEHTQFHRLMWKSDENGRGRHAAAVSTAKVEQKKIRRIPNRRRADIHQEPFCCSFRNLLYSMPCATTLRMPKWKLWPRNYETNHLMITHRGSDADTNHMRSQMKESNTNVNEWRGEGAKGIGHRIRSPYSRIDEQIFNQNFYSVFCVRHYDQRVVYVCLGAFHFHDSVLGRCLPWPSMGNQLVNVFRRTLLCVAFRSSRFGNLHWNFYWATFYPFGSLLSRLSLCARHIVCVKRDAKPNVYRRRKWLSVFSLLSI